MVEAEPVHIKLIVLGESGVGKSSLIRRFVKDTFLPDEKATIGYDFQPLRVNVDGEYVQFNIWDTAGAERHSGYLTPSLYRGSNGAFFVYDVTSSKTFSFLNHWIEQTEQFTNQPVMKMLLGNKVDVHAEREVSKQVALDFARKWGMMFLETSAKTSENVRDAFIELARKILQDPEFRNLHPKKVVTLENSQTAPDESGSCGC